MASFDDERPFTRYHGLVKEAARLWNTRPEPNAKKQAASPSHNAHERAAFGRPSRFKNDRDTALWTNGRGK
jgi:hypothetical protein